MWENHVFIEETPNGPAPVPHVVYLGAGVLLLGWLKLLPMLLLLLNQTAQDLLKQNPTLASCLTRG